MQFFDNMTLIKYDKIKLPGDILCFQKFQVPGQFQNVFWKKPTYRVIAL